MSLTGKAPGGETPGEEALARLPAEAIETFAAGFRGEVILPGDEAYDEARLVWNGMIEKYPAIVARCAGVADVVAAVNFGREQDLPLAVRGGGHNVAGTALVDGGLVIDLSAMNGVRVDPEARTVRAEGGATLGDVDSATALFGLATPLGAISKTGIAGLTLNGGYGHLTRKHGLSCDNLVSVDVVTADGEVVTASEERNPDLFWALRGGGGAFGVVTSFEYALHEVGPEVFMLFVVHRGEHADEALRRFREFTESAPSDGGALAFYGFVPETEEFPESAWGEPMIAFLGSHLGGQAEAEAAYRPLREFAEPVADFSGPTAFVDLQSALDADYPDGRRYYWKATYLADLDDAVLDLVVRLGERSPSPLSTVDVWQLGGAVADLAPDATAFWHRTEPYMVTFEANWDDPADDDANVAWAREGIAEVRELAEAGGGYGNFPGFHEDPAHAVYGGNYERLVEVKERYDPRGVFQSKLVGGPSHAD